MIERIVEIRKDINYSQEQFAKRLNLTKNYISLIETGKRVPSDRTISDICREFFVNEQWLRTGIGEKYTSHTIEDDIAKFVADIIDTPNGLFKKRLLGVMARLTEDQWEVLAQIAEELAKEKN